MGKGSTAKISQTSSSTRCPLAWKLFKSYTLRLFQQLLHIGISVITSLQPGGPFLENEVRGVWKIFQAFNQG